MTMNHRKRWWSITGLQCFCNQRGFIKMLMRSREQILTMPRRPMLTRMQKTWNGCRAASCWMVPLKQQEMSDALLIGTWTFVAWRQGMISITLPPPPNWFLSSVSDFEPMHSSSAALPTLRLPPTPTVDSAAVSNQAGLLSLVLPHQALPALFPVSLVYMSESL